MRASLPPTLVARSAADRPPVWGIGLTRTGTKSLNHALCALGYGAVHWPTTRQLLEDRLEAATDESVAALYRTLDAKYPGSRFVLTERDEDEWIESTRAQRRRFAAFGTFVTMASARGTQRWRDRCAEIHFTQITLYGTLSFDERRFRDGFRRHHHGVLDHFRHRPGDLLRLRLCDGERWDALCGFLGAPVPSRAFPHANRRDVGCRAR